MGHVQKRATGTGKVVWRARYRGPDRRERSKTFARKIDAQQWLDVVEASKHRGEWIDPDRACVTFAVWSGRVEAVRSRRPSTEARDAMLMRRHVLPAFGDIELRHITPEAVQDWIAALTRRGLGADTVRKCHGLLAYSFAQAARQRIVVASPCTHTLLPALPAAEMRFLSPSEIGRLSDAAGPHNRGLILTAGYAGLRFGELTALQPRHVDFLRRTIRVEETLTEVDGHLIAGAPKTRAGRRTVTMPRLLVDELAAHLARRTVNSDFIFCRTDGGPLRRTNWRRRVWLPAVEASVGLPLRPHDLRHSHVAMLIARGVHPKVIQQRLGHASISVTLDTYGHPPHTQRGDPLRGPLFCEPDGSPAGVSTTLSIRGTYGHEHPPPLGPLPGRHARGRTPPGPDRETRRGTGSGAHRDPREAGPRASQARGVDGPVDVAGAGTHAGGRHDPVVGERG